jgi:hypothetical protein
MTTPTPPEPPKIPPFLSYVAGRSGKEFRTHTNIGHAKLSIGHFIGSRPGQTASRDLFVWHVVDGQYELLWTIPRGTPNTELPWPMKLYKPYVKPHVPCNCHNCTS